MVDNERKLYEQRIEVFLKRLKSLFYEKEIPIEAKYCKFDPIVPFEKRLTGQYKPIKAGDKWGKNWERAWFHLKASVPNEWNGKNVVARINLGGESLVFSDDGTPISGLSFHTLWLMSEFVRDRLPITDCARGGEKIDLWVEATAAQLFGLKLEEDGGILNPVTYRNYEATVQYVNLAIFRKDIWDLYLDCIVLNDQMKVLPEKSVRRSRILSALMKAIDWFHDDEKSVQRSRDYLKQELKKKSSASDLTTRAVGHAHLDTAWLWPLHETIRKCARTFSSQIQLIEKYPEYIFGASQAQHYVFVKEYYPTLYEKIKEKIAEGRWEVQGAMWVEADCNLINGESMVRQILYGKNFFRDDFGVDIKNLWLPDVFGYSAAMPQILKKSGVDYFVTQKLSWNQFNRFPHHTFIWRGIDGSEVITHFPPEDNYGSDLRPSRLKYAQENFDEHAYLDEFLSLFGVGDGGSGPTEEMIETGLRERDLENCPRVVFSHAQQFLDQLVDKKDELPRWVGELYFELHRGTLTTQAYNKKMNRYMELKLRELEFLFSMLPLEHYPNEQLNEMWRKVLLNQFHDIIPGSSISSVYEHCRKDYESLKKQADLLTQAAGELLFDKDENALCFFNTLSFTYKRPVVLPESWLGYEILDEAGNLIVTQAENDKEVTLVEIPSLSSITLRKAKKTDQRNNLSQTKQLILENDLIRYEFTDQGTIKSAFDKEENKEIIVEGKFGNVLSLYEDRPANWDAWDIDIYYENQLLENAQLVSQQWICNGPIRQGIQQLFKIGKSTVIQKVYLATNSRRLDFETEVNWLETHKMLRVAFHVNVCSDTATFEIQYGHVKRNTHRNTSWDMAKFEVVGHRFADLSDKDYGVALLNDCKYGYKILDNVIDLNLLRAPTMPDPFADIGLHSFTYSLLPHNNEMIASDVLSEAAQLNQPPTNFPGFDGRAIKLPFSLDNNNVLLEVIKKAEKENATILRLYEPKGKQANVNLAISKQNLKVFETDLMENNQKELILENGLIKLRFNPFEIKTLKVIQR